MQSSFLRVAVFVLLILLAALVLRPYVERMLYAADEPRTVTPRGELSAVEQSNIRLFETVAPSVVQIAALAAAGRPLEPGGGGVQSGSGFVWDAAGHVVTNNHVVENARDLRVRLATEEVVRARVVGRAPNYDLAVIRLSGVRKLPAAVAVGTSHDLRVGQTAYAIGNPFGLDQTLTVGVISALKRRLPTSNGREIADVIQTDAAINPGNSGGPLLDSAGRLIGVNTAIISPSGTYAGIGFAIPVDTVNRIVPQLIKTGRVPTPGIGILVAAEAITAQLGVQGVVVAEVVPGSPADRAGLRGINRATGEIGDVIVAANGEPVRRLADLTRALEETGVGGSVRLTIERNGREVTVNVQVTDVTERG